jgi:hypothetical protein
MVSVRKIIADIVSLCHRHGDRAIVYWHLVHQPQYGQGRIHDKSARILPRFEP